MRNFSQIWEWCAGCFTEDGQHLWISRSGHWFVTLHGATAFLFGVDLDHYSSLFSGGHKYTGVYIWVGPFRLAISRES